MTPQREPAGLAADAFVGDPAELPEVVRRRMGGGGRNWGVRLARDGDGLVIAPVGVLDAQTALRLRDVVDSRRALYDRLLLDLSDLVSVEAPGMAALAAWHAERPWGDRVALIGDDRALAALLAAGLAGRLPTVP